jgi:signal peptidase I
MRQIYRVSQSLWLRLPYRWLLVAVIAAIAGVAAGHAFIGSVAVVSGTSMAPTFASGSWVYAAPISGPLTRGDVVVLNDGKKEYAVKRIVGLPGETVHIWRGYVFINRKVLLEPYVPKYVYTFPLERLAVYVLGDDQYFVLGDNRVCSADSRAYGPVDRSHIKQRIALPEGAPRAHAGDYTLPTY